MFQLCLAFSLLLAPPVPQATNDVPVTIKEIDVKEAIREFQQFQERLGQFRDQIGAGQSVAQETSQILADLRSGATAENGYNEGQILGVVAGYVDGVIQRQVDLVDFLESQRYRITYYANKMAASITPEDLALIFGTEPQARSAITTRVQELERSRQELADFVDVLPEGYLDPETFRPLRSMTPETKKRLDELVYRYQLQRNALDVAKKRLQIVRAAGRSRPDPGAPDIDADLLVGQMFGALDRIRLQMSMDLVYLEQLLTGYAQSSRTQEILDAFQDLIALQGDLEGPSPELASVLDWLSDTSTRRLSLGARGLSRPGLDVPRYSDLLREAYQEARGPAPNPSME